MYFIDEAKFIEQSLLFLRRLFSNLDALGFEIGNRSIDHLCYRVESNSEYEVVKSEMSKFSMLLIESEVGGRLISTFKLNTPICYGNYIIDLVELPAPKKGKIVKSGFEHIEIVINEAFADLIKNNPQVIFDDSTLVNKDFNQELKLDVGEFQIKFHYQSLESVINLELHQCVFRAIKNLGILHDLKEFYPLLPTTQCLDIDNEKSDIDIAFKFDDMDVFRTQVRKLYASFEGFNEKTFEIESILSYVVNFRFQGFAFELFAQAVHPVYQGVFKDFGVKERLLKVGGLKLKQRVIELKNIAQNTEQAFMNALSMKGDPLIEIRKLRNLNEVELKRFVEEKTK